MSNQRLLSKIVLDELILTLLPGTECMAEETYPQGKQIAKRWWDFPHNDWKMKKYLWRTNRLLLVLEPEKYYSTMYFWNDESNEFLCYYINFQLPFKRNHASIDTLDLELDLIIRPDFNHEWKDLDEVIRKQSNKGSSSRSICTGLTAKSRRFSTNLKNGNIPMMAHGWIGCPIQAGRRLNYPKTGTRYNNHVFVLEFPL